MDGDAMKQSRMQRAYELFERVLERRPEERAGFLAEACWGDDALRSEVESLLEHDSRVPSDFMEPSEPKPTLTGSVATSDHDPLIVVPGMAR